MDTTDRSHLTIAQLQGRLLALKVVKEQCAQRYATTRRHTHDEEGGHAARDALRRLLQAETAINEIEAELAARKQIQ